ncbi:MAG: hypothetical protein DA408_05715 [Bacteroidetes bacterium]|nr:MAG: hypothetical protein C7N36_20440 [Bacteroidota bacterium]PTM13631.1 MAG: hypothetical protein DA408_05715 [Bacteroidota bacterium]
MIDKLLKTFQDAGDTIRDQASNLSTGAKDKAYAVIEDWLQIFPQLKAYGLHVESFALGVALSPSLEVDMKGTHADFSMDKLDEILADEATNTALRSVMSTIRTTYALHRKINAELQEPLIVKIRIKLSPEVKVFIGEPLIQ